MKLTKVSHVVSVKKEASRWSEKERFALRLMAGSMSYRQIAPRLGRTYYSVMRMGATLGLNLTNLGKVERARERALEEARKEALLTQDSESLAEFVPECLEEPLLPHVGGAEYFRLKKREGRAREKD